ncbi:hypothetical protein, partial [Streptomyces violaceorubidus]|uniref:hypothetical protein n=1 Tax=Streptomyces violaceorubidus TaxID=284042 RepID=UPI001ADFEBE2
GKILIGLRHTLTHDHKKESIRPVRHLDRHDGSAPPSAARRVAKRRASKTPDSLGPTEDEAHDGR